MVSRTNGGKVTGTHLEKRISLKFKIDEVEGLTDYANDDNVRMLGVDPPQNWRRIPNRLRRVSSESSKAKREIYCKTASRNDADIACISHKQSALEQEKTRT